MKNRKIKKILCFIFTAVICIAIPFTLTSCQPTWHKCMKCGGTGRVRDTYGYYAYVTCDWCHGAGKMYY